MGTDELAGGCQVTSTPAGVSRTVTLRGADGLGPAVGGGVVGESPGEGDGEEGGDTSASGRGALPLHPEDLPKEPSVGRGPLSPPSTDRASVWRASHSATTFLR